MPTVYERAASADRDAPRIRAEARVVTRGIGSEEARLSVNRIVSGARTLAQDVAVKITSEYDAGTATLATTLIGERAAMRLLDASYSDIGPLFDPQAACELVVGIDRVRYELMVALGDHLLNAAKNHPQGSVPLRVRTNYDEEEERLEVAVDGSVFAASYLLLLICLQTSQSRYR